MISTDVDNDHRYKSDGILECEAVSLIPRSLP